MQMRHIVLLLMLLALPLAPAAAMHKPGHDKGGPPAGKSATKGNPAKSKARGSAGAIGLQLNPVSYVHGGPPPWAPAHGYRRKHGQATTYVPPFGIDLGRCNRAEIGAVLGAAAGGLAGSQVGKGSGQTAAIIGGTILGALIGGSIARSMDELDQNCVGQILEHAPEQTTVDWRNPDTGVTYEVTPTRSGQSSDGRYCREYQSESTVGGQSTQTYGTACRQPDGSWQIVSSAD